ncbi:RnfABCDGE type electron transport complex subunit D [Zunongwangia atlantica]|uniref:NQR2 and RnfD family protein n=1 Tax=Zunongwangia atlantica 22II14-10F7 TaxID=1185767 RepID=A0A1Y1T7E5_9FLAO|nr:RnfABCDGE type electron transport complex subunit D [Zunongwangia atlantica]ORL46485.1 NQR2 and RnfD family protein [Zunongwangia atlantica 22II14-10F7]
MQNKRFSPFVSSKNSIGKVMLDVIIALLPLCAFAFYTYRIWFLIVLGSALGGAILTEILFSGILLKKWRGILDGSAIITVLLLVFTISPLTPWYVAAFGGSCAVLFGKILWGGVGKNKFNPALVGREFMTVFFPLVMSSGDIWSTKRIRYVYEVEWFDFIPNAHWAEFLNELFFVPTGALGEYSAVFLLLGGIYLIFRRRISWHIPAFLLVSFLSFLWIFEDQNLNYSLGGILLGGIFMATDMPSSPSSPTGKSYYGLMIGLVAGLCIQFGAGFEYMSYSILILNGFSTKINQVFMPRTWGTKTDWPKKIEEVFLLTLSVLTVTFAVLSLHYYGYIPYLIYIYIIYIIFKFNFSFSKKLHQPI